MFIDKKQKQDGFTLVEIAVVLVIVGLLLGSFIGSFTQRIETTQREKTSKQLENIKLALMGFVSARGRLPCPTTTTGNGIEVPLLGSSIAIPCTLQHGFIPGKTLGIVGTYNLDNLLLDIWGNPVRYSVTTANSNAFTAINGIRNVGMLGLLPDLYICDGDSTQVNTCDLGVNTLIDNAPFVVISLGKDGSAFVADLAPNSDQGENAGEATVAANAAGENLAYTVGSGNAFVNKTYSSVDSAAGLFDDLIIWESHYVLFSRMIEAGQLP